MALHINSFTLRNFRNYSSATLSPLGDITVLVGRNAVGKTNLIEGIQLLTALTSFRHSPIDQLVLQGEETGSLSIEAGDGNRQLQIDLLLDGKTRKYRLNGKGKRPLDLKGLIPSVIFTPDDLNLIKGSNKGRRQALDSLGSQVNKSYYTVRHDYEKVIRHKNKLLKDEADPALVEAINEMLVTVGSQLTMYRFALFNRLIPHVMAKYGEISNHREQLRAHYGPSWSYKEGEDLTRDDAREGIARELHERAEEERRRGRALVGPHADAITFTLDGQDASLYGSQGQQRSIVLAYKLAEAAVIEEILQQKPVLLLDDVMSELDGYRRNALVEAMAGGSQTFITTANIDYFDDVMLEKSQVIQLPLPQ